MAEFPILPLKTDALIADTTHMSTLEFGAYLKLLIAAWRNGGKLPNNAGQLAVIAGVTLVQWQSIKDVVLRPMTRSRWYISQKRLSATLLEVREKRRKNAVAAQARWRNANALHSQCERNANQIREAYSSFGSDSECVGTPKVAFEEKLAVSSELHDLLSRKTNGRGRPR
jgi:uncharacterized protein YdaU (DUF1376 family)